MNNMYCLNRVCDQIHIYSSKSMDEVRSSDEIAGISHAATVPFAQIVNARKLKISSKFLEA